MFDEIVSENDYKTISDSLQSPLNIRQKAHLSIDEVNTCLVAHTLHAIKQIIEEEKRYPTIPEILNIAANIKEELSLSNGGFGIKTYANIMSRELKVKDKKNKKDKEMEIE